jgi:hypothetical protein
LGWAYRSASGGLGLETVVESAVLLVEASDLVEVWRGLEEWVGRGGGAGGHRGGGSHASGAGGLEVVVPPGIWGAEAGQIFGEGDFDAAGDDCGLSTHFGEVGFEEAEELLGAASVGTADLHEGAGDEFLGGVGLALGVKLGTEIGVLTFELEVGLLGVLPQSPVLAGVGQFLGLAVLELGLRRTERLFEFLEAGVEGGVFLAGSALVLADEIEFGAEARKLVGRVA